MRKLIFMLILALCIVIAPLSIEANAQQNDVMVIINEDVQQFEVPPVIIDDRTLVPLRHIFEALGAEIDWDGTTQSITAIKDSTRIFLQVGNTNANVNGQQITIDVPPFIIDGRTLVPLRFVSESLGVEVGWNNVSRIITLVESVVVEEIKEEPVVEEEPVSEDRVFQGYFKNIDYSDLSKFLREGEQTEITPRVQEFANSIKGENNVEMIVKIYEKIKAMKSDGKPSAGFTADELIEKNQLHACDTFATLFTAVARGKGIPAVYVYASNEYSLESLANDVRNPFANHAFVEVYVEGKWYLVDTTAGYIFLDYDKDDLDFDFGFRVVAKGLDSREHGIYNHIQGIVEGRYLGSAFRAIASKELKEITLPEYKQPGYKYIDIRSNRTKTASYESAMKRFPEFNWQ